MKSLILRVRDKSEIERLKQFCEVVYVSKYTNVVGVEIRDEYVGLLEKDTNVISYREEVEGAYQPQFSFC
ncbi:hypothetical protein EV210_111133 [Anaerospora hongkongensis]|uniref:Uncharacterized protein n=1 Tax=Anaerospora hongkongensis TaxID=244830 RepID=A0A4V6NG95_9FIRM|nr:hypothetical protein EV210_111133 [Anaerospora hongkongensis]